MLDEYRIIIANICNDDIFGSNRSGWTINVDGLFMNGYEPAMRTCRNGHCICVSMHDEFEDMSEKLGSSTVNGACRITPQQ